MEISWLEIATWVLGLGVLVSEIERRRLLVWYVGSLAVLESSPIPYKSFFSVTSPLYFNHNFWILLRSFSAFHYLLLFLLSHHLTELLLNNKMGNIIKPLLLEIFQPVLPIEVVY